MDGYSVEEAAEVLSIGRSRLYELIGPYRVAGLALVAAGGNDRLRLVAREGDQVLFEVRAADATSRQGAATR